MTTKTIKTILFASLIAAMILPFSSMQFAEAQEVDNVTAAEIEKMAKKAQKITEKLSTEDNPKKIAKLEKKLNKLLVKLNAVGLYSEEQFENIKAERLNDKPQTEGEEESSFANASARSCRTCGDDKSVHVRVGFDYKLWGVHGTANGYWNEMNNADRNGDSKAYVASWGADYMHTWVQYYCENCNSADVSMTPLIKNKDGKSVKHYGTTSKTIISSDIVEYYPSSQAYSNVKAHDYAQLVAKLITIR